MWALYVVLIFIVAWNHIVLSIDEGDDNSNSKSFVSIFKSHEGLHSMKWSNYIYTYDEEFSNLKRKFDERGVGIKLLELGVQNGGSLHMWRKYFGPSASITGVDINPKVCELLGPNFIQHHNIHTHCFDITDNSKIEEHLSDTFDVILDDASHRAQAVIDSFLILFKKLNPGGVYIIEDLATSYHEKFGGGMFDEKSAIEYFKLLIELLHFDFIPESNQELFDNTIGQKINSENTKYLIRWIRSITFEEQLIFIKKWPSAKTLSKIVYSGNVTLIAEIYSDPDETAKYFQNTEEL